MSDEARGDEVRRKALRMVAARKHRGRAWRELAQVGVLSWTFVIPLMVGVWGGRALEARAVVPRGTLAGIALGLLFGGYGAWRQVRRSLREDAE